MSLNVGKEVAALERMTVKELCARYAEVFREVTNGRNKGWLVKRIAWRMQANAEGGLSERARQRAAELADDADLRLAPPRPKPLPPEGERGPVQVLKFIADDRLPPPGSVITGKYKRAVIQVKVLQDGFEYAGEIYSSLSAVAKAVTGNHCNGYLFFQLGKGGAA